MMGWDGGSWGVGGWPAMLVMMLAFWAFLVTVTIWVIRRIADRTDFGSGERPNATPAEELARRFARGEINENDFKRGRERLNAPPGAQRPA